MRLSEQEIQILADYARLDQPKMSMALNELLARRAENAQLKQDAIAHDLIQAENATLKAQVQRDETVCHGHCQIVGQENETLRAQVARVEKLQLSCAALRFHSTDRGTIAKELAAALQVEHRREGGEKDSI